MMEKNKVLIIGLDGATFKVLDEWIKNNELSNIAKFYSNGVHSNLTAVFPTLSPIEWSSFYTGKNPGKLGILGFEGVKGLRNIDKNSVINATDVKSNSLWGILSKKGKKVGVVNIAATYPPEAVNGFIISGLLTPKSSTNYFYPPEIIEHLTNYKIDLEFNELGVLPDKNIDKYEVRKELYNIHYNRKETIISLLKNFDLDMFIVNFNEIDQLQHIFWSEPDVLLEFYQTVDNTIKEIVDVYNPTHVVLMSDHGFHDMEKKYFYINTWLNENKYLSKNKSVKGVLHTFTYSIGIEIVKRFSFIRNFIPESVKEKSVGEFVSHQIDFDNTHAYSTMWGIFISDEITGSGKYQIFLDELINNLKNIIDPSNNKKIFKYVFSRSELYHGEYSDKFPDVIPIPNPEYFINPNLANVLFDNCIHKPYLTGTHKSDENGILIISGQGIKKSFELNNIYIYDIAPTVLFLLDLPIPDDMDGRVIKEIFKEGYPYAKKDIKFEKSLSIDSSDYKLTEEEEDSIMKKLRALGYVE